MTTLPESPAGDSAPTVREPWWVRAILPDPDKPRERSVVKRRHTALQLWIAAGAFGFALATCYRVTLHAVYPDAFPTAETRVYALLGAFLGAPAVGGGLRMWWDRAVAALAKANGARRRITR